MKNKHPKIIFFAYFIAMLILFQKNISFEQNQKLSLSEIWLISQLSLPVSDWPAPVQEPVQHVRVGKKLVSKIHSQNCSVPEAFECECWKIRYYKQQENWVSTSESIVLILTESELKEGKRMFICVKHGFAACMEMRDCNEGATRFQCKIWWHFLESWSVPIRWWSSVSAIWKLVTV